MKKSQKKPTKSVQNTHKVRTERPWKLLDSAMISEFTRMARSAALARIRRYGSLPPTVSLDEVVQDSVLRFVNAYGHRPRSELLSLALNVFPSVVRTTISLAERSRQRQSRIRGHASLSHKEANKDSGKAPMFAEFVRQFILGLTDRDADIAIAMLRTDERKKSKTARSLGMPRKTLERRWDKILLSLSKALTRARRTNLALDLELKELGV